MARTRPPSKLTMITINAFLAIAGSAMAWEVSEYGDSITFGWAVPGEDAPEAQQNEIVLRYHSFSTLIKTNCDIKPNAYLKIQFGGCKTVGNLAEGIRSIQATCESSGPQFSTFASEDCSGQASTIAANQLASTLLKSAISTINPVEIVKVSETSYKFPPSDLGDLELDLSACVRVDQSAHIKGSVSATVGQCSLSASTTGDGGQQQTTQTGTTQTGTTQTGTTQTGTTQTGTTQTTRSTSSSADGYAKKGYVVVMVLVVGLLLGAVVSAVVTFLGVRAWGTPNGRNLLCQQSSAKTTEVKNAAAGVQVVTNCAATV